MSYLIAALLASGAVSVNCGYIGFGILTTVFLQLAKRGRIYLNALGCRSIWYLAAFGFTYSVIGYGRVQSLLYYLAAPVMAYLAGWVLAELAGERSMEVLYRLLLAVAAGFAVHAALNYFMNTGRARWNIQDCFTGLIRSATGLGGINTIPFSLTGVWLFAERRWRVKAAGLLLTVPPLLFGLMLGTRTQFVILLVTAGLTLLLAAYEKHAASALFRIAGALLLITAAAAVVYRTDALHIRTVIERSALFARLVEPSAARVHADWYRFHAFFEGIGAIFAYPFGGNGHIYYHNMWLDVSRVGGILPLAALLLFTSAGAGTALSLFRNRTGPFVCRYGLLSVYAGLYLNFFVEPIMEGNVELFLAFALLAGAADACRRYMSVCAEPVKPPLEGSMK